MERLDFLLPDVMTAQKIVDDLLLARIEEKHLHVLAKRGMPLGELPEATWRQKSDLVAAIERGIAAGGATGLAVGLVALLFPPADLVVAAALSSWPQHSAVLVLAPGSRRSLALPCRIHV